MINFEFNQQAAPQARSGRFSFGNGWARSPMYFANLISRDDRENLVDTINTLVRRGEPLLPHLGGAIIESQNAPGVLAGDREVIQRDLEGDEIDFTTFWDVLDNLNRNLVIDPNTDRLLFSIYREDVEAIREYLPNQLVEISRDLNIEDSDLEYADANNQLKNEISGDDLSRGMIQIQRDFESDLRIPPYFSIDAESFDRDLHQNVNLVEATSNLLSGDEGNDLAPVIPLRRSILTLEPTREGDRLEPPQEWIDIVNAYRDLNPELLFIKATNVEMNPDVLDKAESDGFINFFTMLRRFTATPTIFLGMDEFAYILMAHGLDGYTHPLYNSPYRTPKRGGGNGGPNHRNFLIRRELGYEKFDQIDSLGCNGPFCQRFNGNIHPSEIDLADQDTLRKCHWYWVRNQELGEVWDAIQEDTMRPGLHSLFSDSSWKKNLTQYVGTG